MSSPINPAANPSVLPQSATSRAVPNDVGQNAVSSAVEVRQSTNVAILQASQQVSIQSGNEPLALLYSAAIDAINQELAPALGENTLQRGLEQGLDVSPEATAERIVSLSTAFFTSFQDNNPDLSLEEQVESFTGLISSGVDQGFAEAREILDGLQVLEGEIAANIDATYELVQQGIQAFIDRMLGIESDASDTADQTETGV